MRAPFYILLAFGLLTSFAVLPAFGDEDQTLDEEVVVDDEGALPNEDADGVFAQADDLKIGPSENADVQVLFTNPATGEDFPPNDHIKFLVSFGNKGSKDFVIDSVQTIFRHPQDLSYVLQNFSNYRYDKLVAPSEEASIDYNFFLHESWHSRPVGLLISMVYHDVDGKFYENAVFNDTIKIADIGDGLDGETIFMYLLLAALAVMVIFVFHQLLTTYGRKHIPKSHSKHMEMGTQGNVDYQWVSKEVMDGLTKKSPKAGANKSNPSSPKPGKTTSPKPKKVK